MLIFLITLYKFAILHSVTSEEDLYKLNKLTKTTFFTRHFFQGFLPTDHIVGKLESAHVALEYTLPSLYIYYCLLLSLLSVKKLISRLYFRYKL